MLPAEVAGGRVHGEHRPSPRLQLLKISDIQLHDLRPTLATGLRQRGLDLDIIASQLGHRDLGMTKQYPRVAAAQVKQAVGLLDSLPLFASGSGKANS
jgi:integrase